MKHRHNFSPETGFALDRARRKATGNQTSLENSQQNLASTLNNAFGQMFAGQSSILSSIGNALKPILSAGPSQQGMSAAEQAALRTQSLDTTGAAYQQASTALNDSLSARGGGNVPLQSGAASELNAQLASEAAQSNASNQLGITEQNYEQGRQNFFGAEGGLAQAASEYNPTGFAGAATGANSSAFGEATNIQQENQAWEGELGSALGGLGSAAIGAAGKAGGFSQLFA